MDSDKIKDLSKAAVSGFWNVVKKNEVHARAEDVDPKIAARLASVATEAIEDWSRKNDRDAWTEIGTVVKIVFGDPSLENVLAYVWDSDFLTFRSWATIRSLNWEHRHYRQGLHAPGRCDPGTVRLEHDRGSWSWISDDKSRLPVTVEVPDEGINMSTHVDPADNTILVVSEIVTNDEPELMRIKLPSGFESSLGTQKAVRRLIAELNMVNFALTHGEN